MERKEGGRKGQKKKKVKKRTISHGPAFSLPTTPARETPGHHCAPNTAVLDQRAARARSRSWPVWSSSCLFNLRWDRTLLCLFRFFAASWPGWHALPALHIPALGQKSLGNVSSACLEPLELACPSRAVAWPLRVYASFSLGINEPSPCPRPLS